ncbi:PREDICTED: zinc finger protein 831 [Galeopterus variegatus]|uniref:Zinc finger protein 831 n=1 Tax=Galeopterus variegatus TaxID=482537 RepID=A0ABM0SF77_GALVR|nr:PREDICTED: zinc finger protein 831 [Galeopterus variegatus]
MEVPEPTCPALPARDQPAPTSGPPGPSGGQTSPHLTLSPVILPPEQGLAPTVFLKALPIPLYHTVPPGGLQPRAPLVTGSLDGGSVPFILSPLLQPEGPGPAQMGKPAAPVLTVNIVGALPVLSPGPGPTLGSPGKARNAGKHLCPHCGRDCLKPSVLEKHIRSHTGERPFPCATCGIAFKTQSNLYKHRRTQTHLNNSRLSSESEGAGGSLSEEGDKAGETSRAEGRGESWSQRTGEGASEGPLSSGAHLSPVAKNLETKMVAVPCPGPTFADRGGPLDSTHMASPGLPLACTQPRRKLPGHKSPTVGRPCSLQRQQATSSEKPWDAKAPEGRLRKCESTDSGYLSRSDSAEQPQVACSPRHSLSEHSAESEGEGGPGPGGARPSLELEKKRLEERIARLISHNQAVVDDPQLDNVRPRKTVLSKQGSIDLPMPYTYKDSFHFDIRAPGPGRRRTALGPASSTFAPLDKSRPLFFHSVPTQLSTSVECVPVTRSNSLPFVEGSRTWLEPLDPQDACPRTQKPLSPRPTPARPGCRWGLTLADVPSGHPRALVRQAAIEDVPCTPAGDTPALAEDPSRERTATAEGMANKKCSQRKLKMFSQEKWQVYGKETFKRIYQKMKTGPHGGKKARGVRLGNGAEPDPPPQEEAAGSKGPTPSQDRRTPVCGDPSVGAKLGPQGSPPVQEGSLVTEPPKQRKTVSSAGGSDQPRVSRAVSSPTLGGRDLPCLGSKSPLLLPSGRLELGLQLPPAPGPLKGGDLEALRLVLPDPKLERVEQSSGDMKETCPWAQTVPRQPSGGSGEPRPVGDKLPSERKKLKVEEQLGQEQPESLEAETPGAPTQPTSTPSWKQESDPKEVPRGPHRSAGRVGEPLGSPGASSAASSVDLKQEGLGGEEPPMHPAALATGRHSELAAQPQAPSILAALADFSPKYLLRLPQGETPLPLPVPRGPGKGQDSLCRSGGPKEWASLVGSVLGTPLSPGLASGSTPGEADSISEDSGWSRRKGVQLGEDKGDRMYSSMSAARESPGSATGAPKETGSFLPTPTCDTQMAQDTEAEIHAVCMGSNSAKVMPSWGVPNPWALGEMSENAPEDPSSNSLARLSPGCPFQPGSFITVLTQPQGMPRGRPELTSSPHSGTHRSCGAQSPFPSLRAEPRLTWCCLSRSLPLPVEQKEKAASVYSALHFPGGSLRDDSPQPLPLSTGGWTRMSLREGLAQISKLSYPTVPGAMSQDLLSEPEQKKGLPHRRAKTSRGKSKQKKPRINPKRYKGNFLQRCVQLKASRRRRPPRLPRSCRPPPSEGLDPCRTLGKSSSEVAGLNLQEELPCATSESSLGCGNEEEDEDECRQTSRTFSPSTSSKTVRENDKLTVKDISPSASEHGDCSHNTAAGSGLPLQSDTCLAVANDHLLPHGKDLDIGLLETQLLPSQDQVSTDPKPCIFSDAQEPSSFGSKGTFPCHDVATSAAAICISVGVHSAEPQDHSWAAGETLDADSPDRKAIAEGVSQMLLPEKPSSERISGSALSDSIGKTHLEIPASGPSSPSSQQEEGRQKTFFPPRGQYGCGEIAVPTSGSDSGKCQVPGLITLKGCVVSSNPEKPTEIPEAPSKSIKKKGLEGIRKQTQVEFSDTSSDDEDRLVIEI